MIRKFSAAWLVTGFFAWSLWLGAAGFTSAQEPIPLPPVGDVPPALPAPQGGETPPLPAVPPPEEIPAPAEIPAPMPVDSPNFPLPSPAAPEPNIGDVSLPPVEQELSPAPAAGQALPPAAEDASPKQQDAGLQDMKPKPPPAFRPIRPPANTSRVSAHKTPLLPAIGPTIDPTVAEQKYPKVLPTVQVRKIGPDSGQIGQVLTYSLIVQNNSGEIIHDLLVEDVIPPGAELVDVVPSGEIHQDKVVWFIKNLQPKGQLKHQVRLRAVQPGILAMNTNASIRFESTLQTSIKGSALGLEVVPPSHIELGQSGLFKITVMNKSSQPLDGLLLTTHLPEGLQHPAGTDIEAELPMLKPGERKAINLEVTAQQPGPLSAKFLLTTATGEQVLATGKVQVRAKTSALPPKTLAPSKAAAPAQLRLKKTGSPVLIRGNVAEYRIEVFNQGEIALDRINITDHLPEELRFVAASNSGKHDAKTGTVTWELANLQPGQTRVIGLKIAGEREGQAVNMVQAVAEGASPVNLQATLQVQPASNTANRGPLDFVLPRK